MHVNIRTVLLCVATALLAACASAQQKAPRPCDSGYFRMNSPEHYVAPAAQAAPSQEKKHG